MGGSVDDELTSFSIQRKVGSFDPPPAFAKAGFAEMKGKGCK
jgi:hypothetical protein